MPAARRSQRCLHPAPAAATGAHGDVCSPPRAGGIAAPSPGGGGSLSKRHKVAEHRGSSDASCSCLCPGLGFAALGRAAGLLHADSSGQSPGEHAASGHWQHSRVRRRRRIRRAERWHLGAGGRSCSAPPVRHRALKRGQQRQEQPGPRARGFGAALLGAGSCSATATGAGQEDNGNGPNFSKLPCPQAPAALALHSGMD